MEHSEPIYSPDASWIDTKHVKLFVATPVHSEVSVHYAQSIFKLQAEANRRKMPIMLQMMKSSLITQGRNLCVAEFLNSGYTHMLFIDSDIMFHYNSIIKMIQKDEDVLSIPYPMKNIHWDKILHKWKVIPSMNYQQACTSGNMYPVRIKGDENDLTVKDGLIELSHSATGCMMLKRQALEKMIKAYPDLNIRQKTMIDDEIIQKKNLYNFFDTYYDKKTKLY